MHYKNQSIYWTIYLTIGSFIVILYKQDKGEAMGINCPKCQFENPEDTRFYGSCGTKLPFLEEISVYPHRDSSNNNLWINQTVTKINYR